MLADAGDAHAAKHAFLVTVAWSVVGPARINTIKQTLVTKMRRSWLRSSHRVRLTADLAPTIRGLKGVVLDVGGGREAPLDVAWPNEAVRYRVDAFPSIEPQVVGDAMTLPIRTSAVDAVVMCELLEHLPRPALAISEARRVLRPGGTLCGSVPFLFAIHGDPDDYWRYTESSLRHLLAQAEFREVVVIPHGNRFTASWTLLCGDAAWPRLLNPLVRRLFARDNEQSPEGYAFTAVA
jgi:SAM-dependent methyltransferase